MWKYWWPRNALLVEVLRQDSSIQVGKWSEKMPARISLTSNGETLVGSLAMVQTSTLRGDEKPKEPMQITELRRRVATGDEKSSLIEYLKYELEMEFNEDFESSPPFFLG